jgi:hypothetical protein
MEVIVWAAAILLFALVGLYAPSPRRPAGKVEQDHSACELVDVRSSALVPNELVATLCITHDEQLGPEVWREKMSRELEALDESGPHAPPAAKRNSEHVVKIIARDNKRLTEHLSRLAGREDGERVEISAWGNGLVRDIHASLDGLPLQKLWEKLPGWDDIPLSEKAWAILGIPVEQVRKMPAATVAQDVDAVLRKLGVEQVDPEPSSSWRYSRFRQYGWRIEEIIPSRGVGPDRDHDLMHIRLAKGSRICTLALSRRYYNEWVRQ